MLSTLCLHRQRKWFCSQIHRQGVFTERRAVLQIYPVVSENRMRISIFWTFLKLLPKTKEHCRSSKHTSKWFHRFIFKIWHAHKATKKKKVILFTCTQVTFKNRNILPAKSYTSVYIVSLCTNYEYLRNPSIFLSSTVRVSICISNNLWHVLTPSSNWTNRSSA